MTKEEQSQALWKAARNLNLSNGSEIRSLAVELRLTKPVVKSCLDMDDVHNSFEFAKVANYLLGDEWLSWKIETRPFVATVKKTVVLKEIYPVDNHKITPQTVKQKPTNTKKALNCRDQFCVTKGHEHREAMSCHYTGIGQSELGCGMGCKGDSLLTAWLCDECHTKFDQYTTSKGIMDYPAKVLHSFLFLMAIAKTLLKKKALGRIIEQ